MSLLTASEFGPRGVEVGAPLREKLISRESSTTSSRPATRFVAIFDFLALGRLLAASGQPGEGGARSCFISGDSGVSRRAGDTTDVFAESRDILERASCRALRQADRQTHLRGRRRRHTQATREAHKAAQRERERERGWAAQAARGRPTRPAHPPRPPRGEPLETSGT
jgi:hypothetical protein